MPLLKPLQSTQEFSRTSFSDILLNFSVPISFFYGGLGFPDRSFLTAIIQPDERQRQQRCVAGCRVKPEDGPGRRRQVRKVAAPMQASETIQIKVQGNRRPNPSAYFYQTAVRKTPLPFPKTAVRFHQAVFTQRRHIFRNSLAVPRIDRIDLPLPGQVNQESFSHV